MGRVTATILFTDLVGSTELRGRLGEEAAEELRRRHDRLLADAVEQHDGRVVKGLGDGVMASFAGASDAVAAALAIQQAVDRLNRSGKTPATLAVRVGLSAGDVTVEGDDAHGTPVIEASRLCAAADGGEILASEVVRLLAGPRDFEFVDRGCLQLKGLSDPVPAWQVAWEPATASTMPMPALLTEVGRIFVGRSAELERLRQLWKQAVAGERRIALLAGEPGVGKTRLAAEVASRVHEEGGLVLAGRCDEDLGVPYQPFVEALRHFIDHTPPEACRQQLGRYGGELARLLPDLSERAPDLPPPLTSDAETERYRLFDAVAAWLAAVSADEPVVLVLDDLQWAAKPTLLLLRHVLHFPEPLRLLVVATYRDTDIGRGHPLGELLADLRRDTGVDRLALSGLSVADVIGFLEVAGGHAQLNEENTALAVALHDETEGNPFFLREVLRHLAETGGIAEHDGRWSTTMDVDQLGIPEGVRDVVGRRLSRLSEIANRVLGHASVIGTEFDLALLAPVCELDEDALLAALEEAQAARLVAELPSAAPRYRFAHTLVRATLYEELSAGRRVRLHRRVAEAIESVYAGRLADHLTALAHHYGRAAAPAGEIGAKAVGYALEAGRQALDQLAYDEAAAWYRRALDLLDAGGTVTGPHRLDVLLALGQAQQRAGDPEHRETLLAAARAAEQAGRTDVVVQAALANSREVTFSAALEVDAERVAVIDAALRALGGVESPERARLLAQLGLELTWEPDPTRRVACSDEALAIARRVGTPDLLARVLLPRFYTIWWPGTLAERLAITAEVLTLAHSLDDPAVRFQGEWLRFRAALEGADADEARRCERMTAELADELRRPLFRWLAGWTAAGVAALDGRVHDAVENVRTTREVGRTLRLADAETVAGTQHCGLLAMGVTVPDLADALSAMMAKTDYATYRCFLALSQARQGSPGDGRAMLAPLVADGFSSLPLDVSWLGSILGATLTVAELGQESAAEALVPLLSPYADQVAVVAAMPFGSISHFLGLLITVLGDYDRAEAAFAAAADTHARMAAPALLSCTRLEWARMLLRRRAANDVERARELLTQASGTAKETGQAHVERQAVALLRET